METKMLVYLYVGIVINLLIESLIISRASTIHSVNILNACRDFKNCENNLQKSQFLTPSCCLSYLNMNLPIGGSAQDNSATPIFHKYILVDKENFSNDLRQAIILFGKLAQSYYPRTPEQEPKRGEPYSLYLKGIASPFYKYFDYEDPSSDQPKWDKIFNNRSDDEKISRHEFQEGLKILQFKWPLYQNESIVYSNIYNKWVDQNIQSLHLKMSHKLGRESDDFLRFLKQFITILSSQSNSTTNLSTEYTPVVRFRNRSESRSIVHHLFDKEPINMRVCNAFINILFKDPNKNHFSRSEFAKGLGSLSGKFSNGMVYFDQFSEIIMEHLKSIPNGITQNSTNSLSLKYNSTDADTKNSHHKSKSNNFWLVRKILKRFGLI